MTFCNFGDVMFNWLRNIFSEDHLYTYTHKVFNYKRFYKDMAMLAAKDLTVEVGIKEDWQSTSDVIIQNGIYNNSVSFHEWSAIGTPCFLYNGVFYDCFVYTNNIVPRNADYWKAAMMVALEEARVS